ncbi:MAG TPA: Trm112 family protein [Archangium sp.]|jgi:hypothetical protein|uniref:Trm112 family protein n=1 Tax=Archangium sp. TaxID=1872627 RepID=UPI002EDAC2B0
MNLPEWLLSTLACPKCKGALTTPHSESTNPPELHCTQCRLAYPIRDGVPELLPGEARSLESVQ